VTPPRTDTRERILESAQRLLRNRGFNGFSYQDIARPLGIRNAAVHYHFATKADLTVAVVAALHGYLDARTREFMANGGDARLQLEGFFAFSRQECGQEQSVCPIGALSSDFNSLPEPVQEAGRRLVDAMVKWMTRVCTVGREQGQFRFEGDPEHKAQAILASLQGARQLTRFRGPDTLSAVITQIRRDLGLTGT
jgi:TetR/AcrR family transcriptional repressor of nem operon